MSKYRHLRRASPATPWDAPGSVSNAQQAPSLRALDTWVLGLLAGGLGCTDGDDEGGGPAGLPAAADAGDVADAVAEPTDTGHPDGPWIRVTPAELVFGVEPAGARVRQAVTIASVGTSDLTISSVELVTDAPGTLFLPGQPPSPWVLAPGTEHDLEVGYAPYGADDTPTATLEIVSDDGWVGDVRVPIRTGQPLPDLRLEPRRLLWERADVVEGDPPGCADAPEEARRAFDVVSSGSAPLQVTGWELGPPEEREHFTVCPAPWEGEANAVPPGERRSWEVVFHPRAAARPVAQVTVEHTHGSGKVELRAAAGPGPRLEVVPDSLSWPDLAAGQCGQQALTLANGGDFATAVTLFRFNPLSLQGTYTLSGETFEARQQRLSAPIRPGESATLQVGYCAPEEGPALGTLEVHHTAVPEVGSPVRVELRGHETPE